MVTWGGTAICSITKSEIVIEVVHRGCSLVVTWGVPHPRVGFAESNEIFLLSGLLASFVLSLLISDRFCDGDLWSQLRFLIRW